MKHPSCLSPLHLLAFIPRWLTKSVSGPQRHASSLLFNIIGHQCGTSNPSLPHSEFIPPPSLCTPILERSLTLREQLPRSRLYSGYQSNALRADGYKRSFREGSQKSEKGCEDILALGRTSQIIQADKRCDCGSGRPNLPQPSARLQQLLWGHWTS